MPPAHFAVYFGDKVLLVLAQAGLHNDSCILFPAVAGMTVMPSFLPLRWGLANFTVLAGLEPSSSS
jgi:hypothetical protein